MESLIGINPFPGKGLQYSKSKIQLCWRKRLQKSALKNTYPCHSTETQLLVVTEGLTIIHLSTPHFPWDKGDSKLSVTWFSRTLWNCFINRKGNTSTVLCYCNEAFKQIWSDLIVLSHKMVILCGLKIYSKIWCLLLLLLQKAVSHSDLLHSDYHTSNLLWFFFF